MTKVKKLKLYNQLKLIKKTLKKFYTTEIYFIFWKLFKQSLLINIIIIY